MTVARVKRVRARRVIEEECEERGARRRRHLLSGRRDLRGEEGCEGGGKRGWGRRAGCVRGGGGV